MKKSVSVMKQEIKALALEVRETKNQVKANQRSGDYSSGHGQGGLHYLRENARYMYISYAILRGKTREFAEQNCKQKFEQKYVDRILERFVSLDVEESKEVAGD